MAWRRAGQGVPYETAGQQEGGVHSPAVSDKEAPEGAWRDAMPHAGLAASRMRHAQGWCWNAGSFGRAGLGPSAPLVSHHTFVRAGRLHLCALQMRCGLESMPGARLASGGVTHAAALLFRPRLRKRERASERESRALSTPWRARRQRHACGADQPSSLCPRKLGGSMQQRPRRTASHPAPSACPVPATSCEWPASACQCLSGLPALPSHSQRIPPQG
jgi:hypothetical protein